MDFDALVEYLIYRGEMSIEEARDIVKELRYQIADCEGDKSLIEETLSQFYLTPDMVSIDI